MRRGRSSSSSSFSRQAVKEKQRRDRMKDLYSTLATLLQIQPYNGRILLPELLDQAANRLKQLKERVEGLQRWKKELEEEKEVDELRKERRRLLLVQVREVDLILEANLVMMVNNNKVSMPFQALKIIEQGGAQITSSSFTTQGDHIYCTVYAQAYQARVGFDAELIESCLMELVYQP